MCWPLLFSGTICNVVVGQKISSETTTSYYGSTADGYVGSIGTVWSSVRGATTGNGGATTNTTTSDEHGFCYSGWLLDFSWFLVMRGFLYFDTSGLPDTCTITGAKLYMFTRASAGQVTVYAGTQADTLVADDFDSFGSEWSSNTTLSANQYNSITLNATAVAAISKTGVTKICVRDSTRDVANTAPSSPGASHNDNVTNIYMSDYTGTDHDPYLEITYTP